MQRSVVASVWPGFPQMYFIWFWPLPPSLFYIKMSHKWKLSSGNFFNLCARIKVMTPSPVAGAKNVALYLTQYDADVCGSIRARGIMPHQSINFAVMGWVCALGARQYLCDLTMFERTFFVSWWGHAAYCWQQVTHSKFDPDLWSNGRRGSFHSKIILSTKILIKMFFPLQEHSSRFGHTRKHKQLCCKSTSLG